MKSFKVSDYKTVSMPAVMYDEFMAWLEHECDGSAPTEALLHEFMYLERTHGSVLKRVVSRASDKIRNH